MGFRCWRRLSLAPLYGQKSFEFWPGASYDSKIPTVRQVLGYEPGDKVTNHAGLVKYMDALAAAAAEPHEGLRVRRELGGTKADLRRGRLRGQHPQVARDQERDPAHCRPPQDAGGRGAPAHRRSARRGLALLRRPRQRDLLAGRRAADRLPPAGRAQRQDGGRRPREGRGADRSHAESGRARPLRELLRAGPRPGAGRQSERRRAQRTVARRARQSLPVRSQSRLDRAHPAGDSQPGEGAARVAAAGLRGSARNGRETHLLLHAGIRSVQSEPHAESARQA